MKQFIVVPLVYTFYYVYTFYCSLKFSISMERNSYNFFLYPVQLAPITIKLVLNSNKTKCMVFTRSPNTNASTGIYTVKGEHIEQVKSYTYLGI